MARRGGGPSAVQTRADTCCRRSSWCVPLRRQRPQGHAASLTRNPGPLFDSLQCVWTTPTHTPCATWSRRRTQNALGRKAYSVASLRAEGPFAAPGEVYASPLASSSRRLVPDDVADPSESAAAVAAAAGQSPADRPHAVKSQSLHSAPPARRCARGALLQTLAGDVGEQNLTGPGQLGTLPVTEPVEQAGSRALSSRP